MNFSSNKKILITIAAFIVVLGVFVCILLVAGSSSSDTKNGTTSNMNYESASIEYNSDDYIQEYTTHEITTVEQMNVSSITLEEVQAMNAYIYGQYYLDAVMYEDNTPTELKLAISGKNFQTSMEVEGMNVSIMYLNGNVYFVDNTTNVYLALTDLLMNSMDVDLSEMEEITQYLSLESFNFTDFTEGKAEINGVTANSYRYSNETDSVTFYFVDNELKQIDYGDAYGNPVTTLQVNDFSSQIPSGMLTLSGLRGTNVTEFFTSYMSIY